MTILQVQPTESENGRVRNNAKRSTMEETRYSFGYAGETDVIFITVKIYVNGLIVHRLDLVYGVVILLLTCRESSGFNNWYAVLNDPIYKSMFKSAHKINSTAIHCSIWEVFNSKRLYSNN